MLGRTRFLFTLVLAFIIFFGVNMVARNTLYNARIDLTEGNIYTLSKESRDIVRALDEPLHIRFFFSEAQANGLPVFQSYATRIRGVLNHRRRL